MLSSPSFATFAGRVVGVDQNHLMGLEKSRQHRRHFFTAVRRTRDPCRLCHMPWVTYRNTTKFLHLLSELINQLDLLVSVLVEEEKMQLVEGGPAHQPVMLLIQGVHDLSVGKKLDSIVGTE